MAEKTGEEKFSIANVSFKMQTIEDHFAAFSDTLAKINAFVETNVNASLESSAYGDLGAKLINIWNYNSSTFNDFHENFDNWSQVVAIISANNSQFAVDANATYRDNAGTLDGVQSARDFVSKSNGLANVAATDGFDRLDEETREVLDSAYRAQTEQTKNSNTYGGRTITYTDAAGNKIEIYYDEEGNLVGKKITDKSGHTEYYNKKGVKIDKLPTNDEYEAERAAKKEELENKFDTNYLNHLDDLKYGKYELREFKASNGLILKYWIYVPDYGDTQVTGIPTIMYIHGGGNDNSMGTVNGYGLPKYVNNQDVTPEGLVIVPFIQNFSDSRNLEALKELTDYEVGENRGDTNKISISGHSNGAKTTYQMINKYPDYYAAAIPISGSMPITSNTSTEIWGFGGEYDHGNMSGTERQQGIVQSYVDNGGTGKVQVLERRGHGYTQDDTYNGTKYVSPEGEEMTALEWAYSRSKA